MTDPEIFLLEENRMKIAGQAWSTTQSEVKSRDVTIMLGYSILGIVLLIAIYFGSMSSGTAAGDLASMIVFP
jgi:hypothetical protein